MYIIGFIVLCLWFFGGAQIVADKLFPPDLTKQRTTYNGLAYSGMIVSLIPILIWIFFKWLFIIRLGK